MRMRELMIAAVALGLLVVAPTVPATDMIPEDKMVITFKNKKGVVTFNHGLHATVRSIECVSCHHTHERGEPIKRCSDCHKKKASKVSGFSVVAPKNSKAYHTKCKGCHKYTLEELQKPAGPTKCKLCHIKD
ncbi:MAG: cytochrome c3 family protein [Gammaproteobacteria bacterium]|nr:cytochrome c3 family protein [Gammaproteobacteria bacterium]